VTECVVCQRAKEEHCQYPDLLAPLPIPTMAWTFISMDFVEGLPKSSSKDVILVVVDRLTKYSHFITLSHPYSVNTVAQLFVDNVFKLHGPPIAILTDRDRIFTSNLWQSMFKSMKISLHYCSTYHPQSDGQTERVNQCLENYLRCMAFLEPKRWIAWLPLVEWWYNTNYHTSLKCTPFEALYGYKPPLISEIMVPGPDCPAVEFLTEKQRMITQLRENLTQAQQRIKKFADLNRTDREFVVGDLVYLKLHPYRQHAFNIPQHIKLMTKYYRPFKILQKIGSAAYKLQLPPSIEIHPVFHVSQSKKHIGTQSCTAGQSPSCYS
jgi:hypothetical protein